MRLFFVPAITLMNRLKYLQKFLLVGLLLALPLVLVMSQYLAAVENDINFSAKEQLGLEYNNPLVELLAVIQRHAALSAGFLSGDRSFENDLRSTQADIVTGIAQVDAVDNRLGTVLDASQSWNEIKANWSDLQATLFSLTPRRSDEKHTELVNQILSLITQVGNNSNLILDPDIDSYYLMDAVITKLPLTTDYFSQIRNYGVSALVAETLTAGDETRLVILSGLATSTIDANVTGYGYVFEYNPGLESQLEDGIETRYQAVNSFLGMLNISVIEPTSSGSAGLITVSPRQYFDAATEAIDSNFALYDEASSALSSLLVKRIDGFVQQRSRVILFAVVALSATVYLFAGFYLAVKKTIATLDQASKRMVSGEVNAALVLDNRDELAQVAIAFNNIATELVTARDKALEANRLKDEFLATMSHELRTPLNSIIGFTGIMLSGMRGEVDDTARNMIKRIKDSGHHLLNLINDILDIAKIEAGRLEMISAPMVMNDVVNQWQTQMDVLAKQKGIEFRVWVDPRLPQEIYGDQERLTQVAINLLSNAIKFTDTGTVRLDLSRKDEQSWMLQVSDTGIGIPPHALEYIFDEFRQVDGTTQRAYGGTGLGLAIVRKLCVAMGGRIQAASVLGEGSTFTATLPIQTGQAQLTTVSRSVDHVA